VSQLSLRKRAGETDSFDVQVGVSAYDRLDTTPAASPPPAAPPPAPEKTP